MAKFRSVPNGSACLYGYPAKGHPGISNLLPADKAMLIRVPYLEERLEKYGDIILEMVHMYRKEKGLAEPELML